MYIQDANTGTILLWTSIERILLKLLSTIRQLLFIPVPSAIAALLIWKLWKRWNGSTADQWSRRWWEVAKDGMS